MMTWLRCPANRAAWVSADGDFADVHGEGVAGEEGVGEWGSDGEDVLDGFGSLDGADNARHGAEGTFRDACCGDSLFVEEAVIASGEAGMDAYRLTVKFSDSGVGVGLCGVVAGSGYQEF